MITGFEKQTHDLTPDELKMIRPMIRGLWTKIGKSQAVKSAQIIQGMKAAGFSITGARVRKLINAIRITKMVPDLVGTSRGYYRADGPQDLENYKKSLDERIAAIQAVRDSFDYEMIKANAPETGDGHKPTM